MNAPKLFAALCLIFTSCSATKQEVTPAANELGAIYHTPATSDDSTKLLCFLIQPQINVDWCWATVVSSVVEWANGTAPRVCEVVSKSNEWVNRNSTVDCCTDTVNPKCSRQGMPLEVVLSLTITNNVMSDYHRRPLTWEETISALDLNRPIVISREFTMGGGHMQVVIGYNKDHRSVYIFESYGGLLNEIPYSVFLFDIVRGNWTGSWIIIGKAERFWQGDNNEFKKGKK